MEQAKNEANKILKALRVLREYQLCQSELIEGEGDAAWLHHLNIMAYGAPSDNFIQEQKAFLEEGRRLHAQGYRLRQTERKRKGTTPHIIPDGAVAWEIVDAGYIAFDAAAQVEYVIKLPTASEKP
jgi:hypothetical protein